ncbi:MAG: EAL domain-containing protein, partial [Acidobacteriota bacterium]|nr:EAL domain-containing protein [Acidobacteriota bacterium]
ENRWRCKDGSYKWVAWSYFPVVEEGIAYGVGRDITEHKAAEEVIRQRDQLLQGIFDSVSSEMAVIDANGIITHVSKSWRRFAQENGAEMNRIWVGTNYFDACLVGAAEDPLAQAALEGIRAVMEERQPVFVLEYPCHSPSKERWFVMQVDPRSSEVGGAVITHTDITEFKRAGERIAHEAFHDSLTGLPNRKLFIEHLHQAVAHAERHSEYMYAVLFLDLDRFKFVNDTLGHIVGDQFLAVVARKLEAVVRPEDIVARLGGDEFTILLSDISHISDTTRVANRINHELSRPFKLDGHDVFTTASIGIALSLYGYSETEEVLRDADTAMYRAKSLGGARYEIFDVGMQDSVMASLKLEADLRLAIAREELRLYYQPIVALEDNRIIGFEALVRWQHPERGMIMPEEFIPIAEQTGLIMGIGHWVLNESCRQLRQWQDDFHRELSLSVNVNLSCKEFSQADLSKQVESVLEQTGVSAGSLKLEITESAVMEKTEAATAMLEQLRDLGVKLHIDDFGTGYSSLSNLHYFHVDGLKIDRSFVGRMGPGDENSEIVQTIIHLAHNLGLEVTAEGVETVEQLSRLRALGCKYGQGFLFSKPVDGEEAKRMIAA